MNTLNPQFSKTFIIDYLFEEVQKIKFMMYDIDNITPQLDDDDFLGQTECTVGEVGGIYFSFFLFIYYRRNKFILFQFQSSRFFLLLLSQVLLCHGLLSLCNAIGNQVGLMTEDWFGELLYADDLVPLADSEEDFKGKLQRWKNWLEAKGLSVNVGKTSQEMWSWSPESKWFRKVPLWGVW